MTNPTDVMAQVQATMTEALDKIPEHVDVRNAVVTVCLDTAKRSARQTRWDGSVNQAGTVVLPRDVRRA